MNRSFDRSLNQGDAFQARTSLLQRIHIDGWLLLLLLLNSSL